MARTPAPQSPATSLSDLLEMDSDELAAAGPTPAEDPLSLVREEVEPKTEISGIPEDAPAALKAGDRVTFHVIVDQFYVLDRLMRKGATVSMIVGNGLFMRTIDDRTGRSWVEDIPDAEAQKARWNGKVPFAMGPAPDPRLGAIQVPEYVPSEYADAYRQAVLDAADEITRNR